MTGDAADPSMPQWRPPRLHRIGGARDGLNGNFTGVAETCNTSSTSVPPSPG